MVSLRNRMKIIPIQSRSIDETLFKKIAGATVQSRCLYVEHVKLSQNESVKRTISPQTLCAIATIGTLMPIVICEKAYGHLRSIG